MPAHDPGEMAKVTLADVQPIFDTYCTRCHTSRVPVLTASAAQTSLARNSNCSVPYIVPGHPEQSFLYYKLGGMSELTITGATCRQKMPSDGPMLEEIDPDAVTKIGQWITDGAE
jgi:hypothetical protein